MKNRQFFSSFRIAVTAAVFATAALATPSVQADPADLDGDGIPNRVDPDVDNDGILNGDDRNVDGGVCKRGPKKGRYVGDRLPNGSPLEKDIDDDGLPDDSPRERDIDGDRLPDDSPREKDIDGDGVPNAWDDDCDGDGKGRGRDDDDDGDGSDDDDDSDDDNDGVSDDDDLGEVEIALRRTEDAPAGSLVRVKIRKTPTGEIEFEVDGRNLPDGTYAIVVNDQKLGDLEMIADKGRTRGETEFETTPDDPEELPLPFDPSGLPVEIRKAGKVLFSGKVPTPLL